ncbi:hypothetical protein ACFPOI_59765 [Nonomuraea angiospora]|uniref:dioxygenase family protein n=1 Tax=Nonomuraea angiospora TaxID=46172 RepID=UPI00178A3C18|nr:hypothetical protein [Nonomuraea angiospora]
MFSSTGSSRSRGSPSPPVASRPRLATGGAEGADREGRYKFRTVMPGLETLGFKQDHSPLTDLTKALELPGMRPLHIHAIVSVDGCLPLTTQIYFDGDPLVSGTIEGPVPAAAVKSTELHDDPVDYQARRTLTCDYVLRPATSPAPARPAA